MSAFLFGELLDARYTWFRNIGFMYVVHIRFMYVRFVYIRFMYIGFMNIILEVMYTLDWSFF